MFSGVSATRADLHSFTEALLGSIPCESATLEAHWCVEGEKSDSRNLLEIDPLTHTMSTRRYTLLLNNRGLSLQFFSTLESRLRSIPCEAVVGPYESS